MSGNQPSHSQTKGRRTHLSFIGFWTMFFSAFFAQPVMAYAQSINHINASSIVVVFGAVTLAYSLGTFSKEISTLRHVFSICVISSFVVCLSTMVGMEWGVMVSRNSRFPFLTPLSGYFVGAFFPSVVSNFFVVRRLYQYTD